MSRLTHSVLISSVLLVPEPATLLVLMFGVTCLFIAFLRATHSLFFTGESRGVSPRRTPAYTPAAS